MASKTSLQDIGDRKLTGDAATALYKSRQEAPEVSEYDYENVEFQAYNEGVTDMNDFTDQYSTTLYGFVKNAEVPTATVNVLLNDALICVKSDDGARLVDILGILKNDYGIAYPADTEFGELFKDTLWNRVSDEEFRLAGSRDDALELLSYFHQSS